MPAARTLIDVPTERGRSAGDDGGQDLQVQPSEPVPAVLEERGSRSVDQVGHLERRPRHHFAPDESVLPWKMGKASNGLAVAPRCR
jgi:hypothetical protein